MRIRPVLALSAVAAALLLAVPQSGSAAARPAKCTEKAVTVHAHRSADPTLLHLGVTNRSTRACTVDRIPTVVFGDLDGAALPVPAGQNGPYLLEAGRTAYAALRTIADPADPEARQADSIAVSPDPSRFGRTFTARELGIGRVVLVWEPVTSWWKSSQAAADRALR
ncbi:DUF4232 domain-containing protein [Streptomyces sp. S1D4-11]|nr:DUF4232 domain-containing protein [Streptomyces sp. S1D4-11]QIY93831.1 DUF4232 domain-containing protein [Streptomyces sp. S1D4-11]